MADAYRIFFDPVQVEPHDILDYDRDAELCSAWRYGQQHGRYYGPEVLWSRVLQKVPSGLVATLLRFSDQHSVHPSVYVRFGLILHRQDSIVRL